MSRRTFLVTVELDQPETAMPSRVVGLAVGHRLTSDGFTGRVAVTQIEQVGGRWAADEGHTTSFRHHDRDKALPGDIDWESREVAW